MGLSRFKNLDEAIEHINQCQRLSGVGHVEPKVETESEPEVESRWWSYTSKQGIGGEIPPDNEAAEHHVANHEVRRDRDPNGVQYQKCRGGRRVIHKRLGGD